MALLVGTLESRLAGREEPALTLGGRRGCGRREHTDCVSALEEVRRARPANWEVDRRDWDSQEDRHREAFLDEEGPSSEEDRLNICIKENGGGAATLVIGRMGRIVPVWRGVRPRRSHWMGNRRSRLRRRSVRGGLYTEFTDRN